MGTDVIAGMGFRPEDEGPHIDELRTRMTAKGLVRVHVDWGPKASTISADDRARYLLDVEWQKERGHSIPLRHFHCRWWHAHCFARRTLARWRRWRDVKLLRMDPYGVRRTASAPDSTGST